LQEIAEFLAAQPRVLVHRDFQSQNIVIKERAACFIDFQGMRPGLPQYDLASVLLDPYVTLTEFEREELLGFYLTTMQSSGHEPPANFRQTFDLCAMQRLMQALGAYGFLGIVKEREHFLHHIPAALANLERVLARITGMERLTALIARLPAS
jgi:aminoglycoside/choline kinase family phosphotransferase